MKKFTIILFSALTLSLHLYAGGFDYEWKKVAVDASRTGVGVASTDNVPEMMGLLDDNGKYIAPNGETFPKGSITARVAKLMLDAQGAMAQMKTVVGVAGEDMIKHRPESNLSNLVVDCAMAKTEEVIGKHVDVGIVNFGGIRVDLYKGDILMDDIVSMLPFTNYLCYVELRGRDLQTLFERMARSMQVIGGAEVVLMQRMLQSVKVGGKEIDPDAVYGVATIDFLLDGGDNLKISENAISVTRSDVLIRDALLEYVQKETAQGRPITYHTDGRVVMLKPLMKQ